MTATFAPSPWPAPADLSARRPWRFGREVQLDGPDGLRPGLQWLMKRNCSIAPRQLLAVYAGLCVVSLLIASGFALLGAPYVLAFAGLELLVLGLALVLHGRHAGDRETVTLQDGAVEVELLHGRLVAHADFRAEWLAVEPAAGQGSLIELSGQGQRVRVGRYLRPEVRAAFAQELRQALQRVRLGPTEPHPESEPK